MQDPIGLAGNNPTLYGYVGDVNSWVDSLGLSCKKAAKGEAKYDPRIRQRAVQDPSGHNFPFSFDEAILKTKPTTIRGGAQGYALRGTKNGKDVVYNIIVKDEVITHRDMISVKNWAQRSKSFGWPTKLENIPIVAP